MRLMGKKNKKEEKAIIDEIFIWKEKIENIYGYWRSKFHKDYKNSLTV